MPAINSYLCTGLVSLLAIFPLSANSENLYQNVENNPQLSMLFAAMESTNLSQTLQEEGPFTLFAPSDEAFAKLRAGTMDTLMRPGNREQLVEILLYHVVAENLDSNKLLSGGTSIDSVLGQQIFLDTENGITLNDETIVLVSDILTDNGVIHIIDSVIFPE